MLTDTSSRGLLYSFKARQETCDENVYTAKDRFTHGSECPGLYTRYLVSCIVFQIKYFDW